MCAGILFAGWAPEPTRAARHVRYAVMHRATRVARVMRKDEAACGWSGSFRCPTSVLSALWDLNYKGETAHSGRVSGLAATKHQTLTFYHSNLQCFDAKGKHTAEFKKYVLNLRLNIQTPKAI